MNLPLSRSLNRTNRSISLYSTDILIVEAQPFVQHTCSCGGEGVAHVPRGRSLVEPIGLWGRALVEPIGLWGRALVESILLRGWRLEESIVLGPGREGVARRRGGVAVHAARGRVAERRATVLGWGRARRWNTQNGRMVGQR